jgi:acyl-CoA synthetase
MNVRRYFGALAARAAQFGPDEVVASVLPAPYGFGLWSAHVVPALYGFPTVLTEQFDAGETLRLIERHRVTVLAAVTSQFLMMLDHPAFGGTDLSSLRVMFTGGERVPYARAAEFEDSAGCAVLQFYGSNEAGPISVTTVADPRERRLRTAGRPVAGTDLRLISGGTGAPGQPHTGCGRAPHAHTGTDQAGTEHRAGQVAVRGPGCTPGYYGDDAANARLFTPDGWMLTGDTATLDDDGYLTITGRIADFIIRGGHNVSAPAVEEQVAGHPRVAQVAVVGVADEVLGERVCAFVVTRDRADLTLDDLRAHLAAAGVSKQDWPERLVCLSALPLGTGGKVDKARLRAVASAVAA